MHNLVSVWLAGCVATTATSASTVFNAIIAVESTTNERLSQALRDLLFVGLGFSFLGSLSLIYFTAFYVRNVKSQSLQQRKGVWGVLGCGIAIAFAAMAFPLVLLVWLLIKQSELPERILAHHSIIWVAIWFGCWGLSLFAQLSLFIVLGLWANRHLQTQSTSRLDIDFGTRLPAKPQQTLMDGHHVFITTHIGSTAYPQTPPRKGRNPSLPGSLSRYSQSSRVPPSSSRTQLVGGNRSAKSSIDVGFPAGEATSIDSAFDRWDTSSVSLEMRAAVGSSPPVTRGGLETIPGSRPESPEDATDGSVLPSSPQERSGSPRAITSDTATTLGDWSSSPSRFIPTSSPPSSPPNFSRPTSKQKNQAMIVPNETSMQETIHPLFRASSPHPPPIATAGTTITASPLANQPITPRTLTSLRSHSKSSSAMNGQNPKSTGHWRAMPSISQYSDRRPSTAGSFGPVSPAPGSPGPSIVDEEDLPPILPGFVLSAGQRSSMLGYASRKSLKKDRRGSQMSGT